jgi:2-dehydro-3-deoxygalactonokinase
MPTGSLPPASLIALDWGTSALRAYLLDAAGAVLDRRSGPWGIMQVPPDGFGARFDAITAEWRQRWPGLPAIAAGMIGSAQGWTEAPYCPLPAGAAELARRLAPVAGAGLVIVPGLMQGGGAGDTHGGSAGFPAAGDPDVMRGEETQIVGALDLRPALHRRARLVMPGTHCKWVEIAEGRIVRFATYMTGELFAVLRQHSILGRLARPDVPPGDGAFLRGVEAARDAPGGATSRLFSARALVLTGHMRPEDSLDYLSGLLIGDEIRTALAQGGADNLPVTLIGEAALCGRYDAALKRFGVSVTDILDNTAPAGLWRIAARSGMLGVLAN